MVKILHVHKQQLVLFGTQQKTCEESRLSLVHGILLILVEKQKLNKQL